MVFTSLHFFAFFPLVCVLAYLTPAKYRWVALLVASYYFYLNTKPIFLLLTAGITLSTYVFTRLMDATEDDDRKRRFMWCNVVLILLPLFFFKYFETINREIMHAVVNLNLSYPLPDNHWLLPVGISFYTFMAIGYTIDVYNEELEAEKNLGIVALFITFFPLVLSGPIERAGNMLPQFRTPEKLKASNLSKGLKLMLWGYFMKLVVADRLGIYIDEVYSDTAAHNGSSYLIAMLLYPFQLYGDLGGYSLIAIGAAKVMGFQVMMNFRRPFFSVSMSEFWRRWHISLITWITDYIYTPLSFSFRKRGKWGIVIALLLAFFISGIWHGASLTFVAWGLLQGIFLSVEALTMKSRADFRHRFRLGKQAWFIAVSCVFTFLLFSISQVFARSSNLSEAFTVLGKLVVDHGKPYFDFSNLTIGLGFLGLLMLSDFRDEFMPGRFKVFDHRSFPVRFMAYLAIFFCIVIFGVVSDQFIYFNF